MTDRAWKRQERQVAAQLGGRRNANNGQRQADIDAGRFAVEHKARKMLPAWLTEALQQAQDAATADRVPLVVLSEVRQGVKARRYALLSLEVFAELVPLEAMVPLGNHRSSSSGTVFDSEATEALR